MPDQETIMRAQQDAEEGKSPSTQTGEFVREEIHHVREGKHGVRNAKQAVAIGLSKARKAGVKLSAPPKGTASAKKKDGTRKSRRSRPSAQQSRATIAALKRAGRSGASHRALSRQTRTASSPSQAVRRAARTRTSRAGSTRGRGR